MITDIIERENRSTELLRLIVVEDLSCGYGLTLEDAANDRIPLHLRADMYLRNLSDAAKHLTS